jgi:hypothetical protein
MIVLLLACLSALALGCLGFSLLRRVTCPRISSEDLNAWIDIDWQSCRPLERLLDPAEFAFLKPRLSDERIRQLRSRRRELFRMYLRRLAHDFNTAHALLRSAMADSPADRPELARDLGRQRLLFYHRLVRIELQLALDALGIHTVPRLDLLEPLERLHTEFQRLAPAAVTAHG